MCACATEKLKGQRGRHGAFVASSQFHGADVTRLVGAEWFRTSPLYTYKLCDYYSPIPILSLSFTPSLYVAILNLQDFLLTCNIYSFW